MSFDESNEMFRLAVELMNQSSRPIFLTGKAGTGKTTFLKHIRSNCPKQMAVVAPTGVAAINAGGVTIHSFFQLPFTPFLPEAEGLKFNGEEVLNRHDMVRRLKITSEKRKVLQRLELLIIDEVSMVRCDIIDAIDAVLRFIRKNPFEAFGGVQVLFIGDMYQLPPVVKDAEWKLLSTVYDGPFFFDSQIIKKETPLYIEFKKIYRQSDQAFIDVLNQVRDNNLEEEGARILESRFMPSFRRNEHEGYILLTTHNEMARNINSAELRKLNETEFTYKATITGEFFENMYPADELLQLKKGAQVMFIKNDLDKSKRYYNGKIGVVAELNAEKIMVQCRDEDEPVEVKRDDWLNVRYSLNKSTQKVDEEEIGSFSQFPLRLAWAITIHKSQGLTFEKAIIDAGQSFAPGQVYVALSRCTSLEGLVLQSRINRRSLMTDPRIVRFSEKASSAGGLERELLDARKSSQERLAISVFDFNMLFHLASDLKGYLAMNSEKYNEAAVGWSGSLWELVQSINDTSTKFHRWIRSQFVSDRMPDDIPALKERSIRAAIHFTGDFDRVIELLSNCPVETDSKQEAKTFNDHVRDLFAEVNLRRFLIAGFDGTFDIVKWHERKNEFVLPPFAVNAYATAKESREDVLHPQLYNRLKKLRDSICARKDLPIYMVVSGASLNEMVQYLPLSQEELLRIKGFGEAKVRQYGDEFLEIIREYCNENGLDSLMDGYLSAGKKNKAKSTKPRPGDSKSESFRLFNEGLDVASIASERNFHVQTIEGHLSHYVATGEIEVTRLLQPEKFDKMKEAILSFEGDVITALKNELGEDFSFGEIRLALAWKKYKLSLEQAKSGL